MARMAGEVFHQTMTAKEKPIVPGFNSEDLMPTPELPKATPSQEIDKDSYILNNPKSGVAQSVFPPQSHQKPAGKSGIRRGEFPGNRKSTATRLQAMSPLLLPGQFIREAVQGIPTAPGTLHKGPDPFQENNKIRPSDSDNQFMDVMRSGFV